MLIPAVETYLAVRRAADFKLDAVERYLRSNVCHRTGRHPL